MTDQRSAAGGGPETDLEHDEYHSSLELDDTSGWRVFIVPGLAILFMVAAIAFFLIYSSSEIEADPRVQANLKKKQEAAASQSTPAPAMAPVAAPTDQAAPGNETQPAEPIGQ